MRRPRQEDLDEGRSVRRRFARWRLNVFNRPFWNPFGGALRPQPRQQVVPYPPDIAVEDAGLVEDVEIDADGEHGAEIRVTGFSIAGGTNLLLDPNNVNRRPLSQSLGGNRLPVEQRLDNQHRAEEEAEEVRNNVNPEATRRRQNWFLAERRAALEWDAETARIRQIKLLVQLENRRIAVIEGHVDYRWGQISSGTRSQNSYY